MFTAEAQSKAAEFAQRELNSLPLRFSAALLCASAVNFIFPSVVRFIRRLRRVRVERDVTTREAEFAQFVLKRLAVHAEDGGGARHVAAGLFEAAGDVASLELAPVVTKISRERNG